MDGRAWFCNTSRMRNVLLGPGLRCAVSLACVVGLGACKSEPDKDVSKRKQIEQIVQVDAIESVSAKFKMKMPEGFVDGRSMGMTLVSEQGLMGPTIHLALRIESSAPKDGVEAMQFNDQSAISFAQHDLADGFVVTNTPKKGDANYYTVAVRKIPGLPTLASGTKLVFLCEVTYGSARELHREKELVAWMESLCADAKLQP